MVSDNKDKRYVEDVTYMNSSCYQQDLDDICYEPQLEENDNDEEAAEMFGY